MGSQQRDNCEEESNDSTKEQQRKDEEESDETDNNNVFKVHISRVPTNFTEDIVARILREHLVEDDKTTDIVEENRALNQITVELIYPRTNNTNEKEGGRQGGKENKDEHHYHDKEQQHRGFGYVTLPNQELYEKAVQLETLKGGRKSTSKKLKTMYLRPYATQEETENRNICYLWTQRRCPYGDEKCKFEHSGPGACALQNADDETKKKKGKCFAYKKGKCNKGDDCPFSHDFEPLITAKNSKEETMNDIKKKRADIPKSEKDCINWKTKGKCRKGDKCPYRHDPDLLEKAQAKIKKRKSQMKKNNDDDATNDPKSLLKKNKKPRVN